VAARAGGATACRDPHHASARSEYREAERSRGDRRDGGKHRLMYAHRCFGGRTTPMLPRSADQVKTKKPAETSLTHPILKKARFK
jgi:hypothetical protein